MTVTLAEEEYRGSRLARIDLTMNERIHRIALKSVPVLVFFPFILLNSSWPIDGAFFAIVFLIVAA